MTRQQTWAREALGRVQAIRDPSKGELVAQYRTHCMNLPVLIKQSGLVQALSFLRSRDKDEGSAARRLCDDLAAVYNAGRGAAGGTQDVRSPGAAAASTRRDAGPGRQEPVAQGPGEVLVRDAYQADDLLTYLALTRDLIDIAVWFRRFAQSELPSRDGEAGDEPRTPA